MAQQSINSYRALDPDKLIRTTEKLAQRIGERFPEAGLYRVAQELLDAAHMATANSAALRRPIPWVRVVDAVIIMMITVLLGVTLVRIELTITGIGVWDFIQVLEAGINDVILIGAALFFLLTLEKRIKRGRALKDLHELRSLAHVVDMHQLTKDPDRISSQRRSTPSSPQHTLTAHDLGRYLDYCSELLAVIGKLAALYVQNFDDAVVLSSVDEIESLTNGLSRKIWQKVMILYEIYPEAMGASEEGVG